VDSAVVRLIPGTAPQPAELDLDHFAQLVSRCFQQRRKTLRNGLKSWQPDAALDGLPVPAGARPDTLSVADFVALSNHLLRSGAGAKGIEPATAPAGENADGLVRGR
jgi:16S rRNA (adenine1518-N6/adenine1519-N6)-dimethyltransferase